MKQYSSDKNKEFYEHDHAVGGKFARHDADQYGISKQKIVNFARYMVVYYYQLHKVAEWMNKKGGDVLDLACGDAVILREAKGITSYTGIDISKSRIEYCKKTYKGKKYTFLEGDILALKQDLPLYDTILLNEIIEHVPDPKKVLSFVKKHLKPNGILILSTPIESRYLEGIGKVYEDQHLRVYSAQAAKDMLVKNGFDIKQAFTSGFQLSYTMTLTPTHPVLQMYKRLRKTHTEREMPFEMKKIRTGLLDSQVINGIYTRFPQSEKVLRPYMLAMMKLANMIPTLGEQVILIAQKHQ